MREIPRRERRADRRRRRALAVDRHGAHPFHAERPRIAAKGREVAGPAAAEAEILAYQQPAHAQAAHEHGVDERLGLERCESSVEPGDVRARDAAGRELLDLVPDGRQPWRRRRLCEELARRRVERQHRRRQRQVIRSLDEPREHRLVAAMDTVEIADRQGDRKVCCRRKTAKNAHQGPSLPQNRRF